MTTQNDILTKDFLRFIAAAACDENDLWALTEEQMEFARDLDERDPNIAELVNGATY